MALRINNIRRFRFMKLHNNARYKSSSGDRNFVGRDLIDLNDFTRKEIQDLIWTAIDMKCTVTKGGMPLLAGKSVTILLKRPCIKTQLVVPTAVELLGGHCNVFIQDWEKSNVKETGKFLSCQSDLIFCLGDNHELTCELANGAKAPVVCILSDKYAPFKCLIDLLTVTEHFGRLKKLSMGYVGPPGPLFKSYLTTLPRLKMDLKFNHGCIEEDAVTRELSELAMKYSQKNGTELRNSSTHAKAVSRAHVVATAYHQEEDIQITSEDMKTADVNWMFLHSLPRSDCEVSKRVFKHKRARVWQAVSNTKWMAMAVVLRLIKDYHPTIERPDFDRDEENDLLCK